MTSMRVLFHALGELGHHLATFPLASALRSSGHDVVYLAIVDFRREIESRGFRFASLYDDLWPLGKSAELGRLSGVVSAAGWQDPQTTSFTLTRTFDTFDDVCARGRGVVL